MEAGDAKSLSPDGPVSTHFFSDAAWNKWLDHARASQQDLMPGAEPCDHRELSEAQGVRPPTQNHRAAGVEAEDWRGQGRVGGRWGRQGGGGQVCH